MRESHAGWVIALAITLAQAKLAATAAAKAKEGSYGQRLDTQCTGCFPSKRTSCKAGLWLSCCAQEMECHDVHCLDAVTGALLPKTKVRVKTDFTSNDEEEVQLTKGMNGRVVRLDGDGDAYIKFWDDDDEDESRSHWVFKHKFWEKLELPGNMHRVKATKAVVCMNNCTLTHECLQWPDLSKKQKKSYQKCVQACRIDACTEEDGCKQVIEAYGSCKQKTASSGVCSPLASKAEF